MTLDTAESWKTNYSSGFALTPREALALESKLMHDAADRESRAKLIGYYATRKTKDEADTRLGHITWFVENDPTCGVGDWVTVRNDASPHARELAIQAIVRQSEQHWNESRILCSLGNMISVVAQEQSVNILRRAHSISFDRAETAFQLARCLRELGRRLNDRHLLREATDLMQEAIENQPNEDFSNGLMFFLAAFAFENGEIERAEETCKRMLKTPEVLNDLQNMHTGNIILGRIALLRNEMNIAIEHLLASTDVGDPARMSRSAPMMELAAELLVKGERPAVIKFLNECHRFRRPGRTRLTRWIALIQAGRTPRLKGDDGL